MRLQECWNLTPTAVARSVWFRGVPQAHARAPLGYTHTVFATGRFNAGSTARPGIPVVYLAETQLVAEFEVGALLGSPLPGRVRVSHPNPHWTFFPVEVQLKAVVELTAPGTLALLETSVQELTGDWIGYPVRVPHPPNARPYHTEVPTQQLGHAVHGTGEFEALLAYSAKVPHLRNLIVFPDRLLPGSFLRVKHPRTGRVIDRLP